MSRAKPACTGRADYHSNGVDVRPRISCEAFSREPPYCYVVASRALAPRHPKATREPPT